MFPFRARIGRFRNPARGDLFVGTTAHYYSIFGFVLAARMAVNDCAHAFGPRRQTKHLGFGVGCGSINRPPLPGLRDAVDGNLK